MPYLRVYYNRVERPIIIKKVIRVILPKDLTIKEAPFYID
jgi:hypothetical protein